MLVTPGGDVPWAHLSDDASDYPPNAEVAESVRRALSDSESRFRALERPQEPVLPLHARRGVEQSGSSSGS